MAIDFLFVISADKRKCVTFFHFQLGLFPPIILKTSVGHGFCGKRGVTLEACPRIAFVARARLVESDFSDHLRRIAGLFNENDQEIWPSRLGCSCESVF